MDLTESYALVRRSIIAFTLKYIPIWEKDQPRPEFPPIIGTGFVISENGLICTNDHVARAFWRIHKPPDVPKEDWGVHAMLLKLTPEGMIEIPLEIAKVLLITKYVPAGVYYGGERPDLAIVQVKTRGLLPVDIDFQMIPQEGTELATAGFPMGTDALTAPGWLHQITPTLQRGIVSGILPFACENPHAFTINVMTQGGASGSPVFCPETAKVVGALYAGLQDRGITLKSEDYYHVPTNISYVVPAYYLEGLLPDIRSYGMLDPGQYPTLDDLIAEKGLEKRVEFHPQATQRRAVQEPQALAGRLHEILPWEQEDPP